MERWGRDGGEGSSTRCCCPDRALLHQGQRAVAPWSPDGVVAWGAAGRGGPRGCEHGALSGGRAGVRGARRGAALPAVQLAGCCLWRGCGSRRSQRGCLPASLSLCGMRHVEGTFGGTLANSGGAGASVASAERHAPRLSPCGRTSQGFCRHRGARRTAKGTRCARQEKNRRSENSSGRSARPSSRQRVGGAGAARRST